MEFHYGKNAGWYYRKARSRMIPIITTFLSMYGPDLFVENLSSPSWFDCFAAILGLEEMGAGSTRALTVVLKELLTHEDDVAVVGGKKLEAYRVPKELDEVAYTFGMSENQLEWLKYSSRITVKVDNHAIQDGFEVYQHVMVISMNGSWTVIQQGMNPIAEKARRYHWHSGKVKRTHSFVDEPHQGIFADIKQRWVLDMTAKSSEASRRASVSALEEPVNKLRSMYKRRNYRIVRKRSGMRSGKRSGKRSVARKSQTTLPEYLGENPPKPTFTPPTRGRVNWKLVGNLHENPPEGFEELLGVKGVGPVIVRLLAMFAEQQWGIAPSYRDPALLREEMADSCRDEYFNRLSCTLLETVKSADIDPVLRRNMIRRISWCPETTF